MSKARLLKYHIEYLLIFFLSPLFPFLISQIQNEKLSYLVRDDIAAFILVILVIARLGRANAKAVFFGSILIVILFAVEIYHVVTTGLVLEGLTDIRMFTYSPLFAPILIFSLYSMYLTVLPMPLRILHIRSTVYLYTFFSLFFSVYWALLFFGLIPMIPGTNYLNANSVSYASLFVFTILFFFKGINIVPPKYYNLFMAINIVPIFLNTTRGAVLVLFLLVAYKCYVLLGRSTTTPLRLAASLTIIVFGVTLVYSAQLHSVLLGRNLLPVFEQYQHASLDELDDIGEKLNDPLKSRRSEIVNNLSGGDFSTASRLFSNYIAAREFSKHPLFGIGTVNALSINVLGNGLHSFIFLLLASSGIIGILVFLSMIGLFAKVLKCANNTYLLLAFAFCIMIFTSRIPPYFAILFLASAYVRPSSNEMMCN